MASLYKMLLSLDPPPLGQSHHVMKMPYTAISRMVVGKNVHVTIPKGNMGYDHYHVPNDCNCRTYFCCFPLVLANLCPWPPIPFFQISLQKSELKTTHNTLRDCRVHFFREPFSKQLYMRNLNSRTVKCNILFMIYFNILVCHVPASGTIRTSVDDGC